ncbi:uncharacterized protein LOC121734821 [Aricia agestis]|uniref:uncharacterized protein LOC121734821 n=1 Tax=Aricia agestis TaxID=91739 RepID=UPI001C207B05|nr:uncharacterized protein LOC121734821 [Aricia agestis]
MCLPLATCCFCISLDVGSKIISILNLVFSTLTVVVYGSAALLPHVAESRRVVYAAVAAAAMLHLLAGAALAYGTCRKKPSYLLPWAIVACVSGAALTGLAVLGAALLVTGVRNTEVSTMVSVYFVQGVMLYYLSSVVSSRRQEIIREDSTESAERLMRRYHGAYKFAV